MKKYKEHNKSGLGETVTLLSLIFLLILTSCGDTVVNGVVPASTVVSEPNLAANVPTQAQASPTVPATSVVTATLKPIRPTATPYATRVPDLITTTPSVVNVTVPIALAGEKLTNVLWAAKGTDIRLRVASEPPAITYQEAMKAIYNVGYTWALGGQYKGKQISISATYGRGDIGYLDSKRGIWFGPQNQGFEVCAEFKKCTITKEKYPRFENRMMWVIDYGNLDRALFLRPPSVCEQVSCVIPDHHVMAVDTEFKSVIYFGDYNEAYAYKQLP